jgi:hypothetical protein
MIPQIRASIEPKTGIGSGGSMRSSAKVAGDQLNGTPRYGMDLWEEGRARQPVDSTRTDASSLLRSKIERILGSPALHAPGAWAMN